MRKKITLFALFVCSLQMMAAAQAAQDPAQRTWHAAWVTHPKAPLREPLVLHFRRTLDLAVVPSSYVVRVSADNRFILWVNGQRVGDGPARGDLNHWRYEQLDLAPALHAGHNLITATVWNWGIFAPIAQMSDRTAFLLESEATGDSSISTPKGWFVEAEPGHHPLDRSSVNMLTYFASGPGEVRDAAQYDWNWDAATAAGASWMPVSTPMLDSIFPVNQAHSAGVTGDNPWSMVPDRLPHMEVRPTDAGHSVRTSTDDLKPFPASPVTVPANRHVHILLDRGALTTAYPHLTVSGGKGAQIWLTYSEALYDNKLHKGDRDSIDYTDAQGAKQPRIARGLRDEFLPDGGDHRFFEPMWWRAWRYLDLDIQTGDAPLTLESLSVLFTAYPFQEQAKLHTGDPDLDKIWEISWRTARLDAHETYMDTPYYEQLQYVGDTRIQALISYTVANDDRLARQAIEAFDLSRSPDGLTRSRYPSSLPQTIPPFSLLWIGMLRDAWMYRPDPDIVRQSLPGSRAVLAWFEGHERPDGLLEKLPWWSFIDWVNSGEIPTYDAKNESCVTTLQYLGALEDAAALEQGLGDPVIAQQDKSRAAHVRKGIADACWSASRGLLADNPDQKVFSQQSNILAVLYDVIPADRQQEVLKNLLAVDPRATSGAVMSASYYFRFYLARALDHAGMGDAYLTAIDPWRKLLPLHFSTWPETIGETRSDSHAWSAHPIYDLLTLVAGVEPASPGFATVRIAPHLGSLPALSATFPHPAGNIQLEYHAHGSALDATITLPEGLSGTFVWHGNSQPLHAGANHIDAH